MVENLVEGLREIERQSGSSIQQIFQSISISETL
jgi:hypothetical protein